MRKFFYGALALASVATLASCSSEEPIGSQPNDGKVTFTVSMPGENTRFADGTSVDQLYYTVFQGETKVLDGVQKWPKGDLSTTVTLQLVANQSYDVVFFADTKEAEDNGVYKYTAATADFTVAYNDAMVNSDPYDAFVKKEAITADGGEKKVLLYRPFAQVNIGTDDLGTDAVSKYGLGNFSSTLKINKTGLLSGMNFFSGDATAQANDVTFSLENFSTLPGDKFPVDGTEEKPYKYIEMNYLLVPAAPEGAAEDWNNLLNVTYTINGKQNVVNELNLSSMPTRQNYQTNIYGSLLTTQQTFNVEIKPAFTTPAFDVVIPANDAATFTSALQNPNVEKIYIPAGVEVVLPAKSGSDFYSVNGPNGKKEILIDGKIIMQAGNPLCAIPGQELTIKGGTIEGAPEQEDGNGVLLANYGGKLTVSNTNINYNGAYKGTAFYFTAGDTEFTGVTVYSKANCMNLDAERTNRPRPATFVGTNCTIIQDHPSDRGIPTAAVNIVGDYNVTLKDCNVTSYEVALFEGQDRPTGTKIPTVTIDGGYYASFSASEALNSQSALRLAGGTLNVSNAKLYTQDPIANLVFVDGYTIGEISKTNKFSFSNTYLSDGKLMENDMSGLHELAVSVESKTATAEILTPAKTTQSVEFIKYIQ